MLTRPQVEKFFGKNAADRENKRLFLLILEK